MCPEENRGRAVLRYKPPAKVDGLLHFSSDVRSTKYTDQERRAMIKSESGRKIAEALARCSKIKEDLTNASANWVVDKENKDKLAEVERERNKYIECLAFVSCKERWIQYSDCWRSLNKLSRQDLQRLDDIGLTPCSYERRAVEQCVGKLVSSTMRVAVEATDTGATELSDAPRDIVDLNNVPL